MSGDYLYVPVIVVLLEQYCMALFYLCLGYLLLFKVVYCSYNLFGIVGYCA